MQHPSIRTLVPLLAVALAPALTRAAEPLTPDAFDIRYSVLAPDASEVRQMGAEDLRRYVNQARCECGQQIGVSARLKEAGEFDVTKLVSMFIGPMCAAAEGAPAGQFSRCTELAVKVVQRYLEPETIAVHPIWLTNGVAAGSTARDPANAVPAGACTGYQGESSVWMCAQTNAIVGCQEEEFFVNGDPAQASSERPSIAFDFLPPVVQPTGLTAEPAPGGVTLRWDIGTVGDIAGYRVLCEEVETGAAAGLDFDPPDITGVPDGQHYFNAHNLCGEAPFSTVQQADPPAGACGDGRRDEGEECDAGEDNRDGGPCASDCRLRVSAELAALDWGRMCSGPVDFSENSVTVAGLDPDREYRFLLVTFDAFGNPRAVPEVVQATPEPAAGGCRIDAGIGGPGALVLVGLGLLARRRRR